jgi:hypothetical protein
MRSTIKLSLLISFAALAVYACSSGSGSNGFGDNGDGGTEGDGSGPLGDGGVGADVGNFGDGNINDTGSGGTITIYAHTDTELYTLDPATNTITDIGPFQGTNNPITDLAVNSKGEVWVNSETAIYQATVPQTTGPVTLVQKAPITVGTNQKFFALAFTPAGALAANEVLIAGDNKGELYSIDESTGKPTRLGGFGATWQLSGDLVFYNQGGTFKGLATIRTCGTSSCKDSLASVDMNALKTAYTSGTAAASLLGQTYGSGTGFAALYGVGAWQDKVYAFSRKGGDGGAPAQLVEIDGTGVGTSIKSFPNITSGWSGAGVTTTATITVPPPK